MGNGINAVGQPFVFGDKMAIPTKDGRVQIAPINLNDSVFVGMNDFQNYLTSQPSANQDMFANAAQYDGNQFPMQGQSEKESNGSGGTLALLGLAALVGVGIWKHKEVKEQWKKLVDFFKGSAKEETKNIEDAAKNLEKDAANGTATTQQGTSDIKDTKQRLKLQYKSLKKDLVNTKSAADKEQIQKEMEQIKSELLYKSRGKNPELATKKRLQSQYNALKNELENTKSVADKEKIQKEMEQIESNLFNKSRGKKSSKLDPETKTRLQTQYDALKKEYETAKILSDKENIRKEMEKIESEMPEILKTKS